MRTCHEQSIQPRISSFVSDHLDRMYNTIGNIFCFFLFINLSIKSVIVSLGGSHIYHPTTSFTQSISVQQEKTTSTPVPQTPPPPSPSPAPVPTKKESVPTKLNKNPPSTNVNKQKIIPKKKPIPPPPSTTTATNPVKEEKKTRVLSPIHSPSDLVDISPSPPSMENEQSANVLTPSPPPPVVHIASPLRTGTSAETPKKSKRSSETNLDEKRKKIKTEEKRMFLFKTLEISLNFSFFQQKQSKVIHVNYDHLVGRILNIPMNNTRLSTNVYPSSYVFQPFSIFRDLNLLEPLPSSPPPVRLRFFFISIFEYFSSSDNKIKKISPIKIFAQSRYAFISSCSGASRNVT